MKVLTIITTYFMAEASQEDTKNHLLEQRKCRSCLLLGNSKYELLPRICVSGYQTRLVRTQTRKNGGTCCQKCSPLIPIWRRG